jgi:hypothetical protein
MLEQNVRPGGAARAACAALVALLSVPAAPASAAAIDGIANAANAIRRSASVPVYLPTTMPDSVLGGGGVRASVLASSRSAYDVDFYEGKGCARPACRFGFMRGMPAPSLQPTGRVVALPRGGTAYYVPAACGAVCGPSTLTWTRAGTRYELGLRGADANALRFMASSVRRF